MKKKQSAPPAPKKPLPKLASGVLHKELPRDVPDKLPTILPKPASFGDPKPSFGDPKPELPSAFGDLSVPPKSIFSDHKEEPVAHEPLPRKAYGDTEASFFSDLARHLSTEEELLRKKLADPQGLLNRNLVAEMKEYWESQKAVTNSSKQHKELEADVLAQVEELRRLEADWQRLEQEIEDAKKQMMEKELQIEQEGRKLKALMKRWALKKDCPREQWFNLSGGLVARNVPELAFHLRKLDSHHFHSHVTLGRNDFATWVRDVFHDDELASALEQESEKHKIVDLLDKATQ